jgi:Ca2+ transporting ATPase
MGGANNICSDKTGTLTRNLMTVSKIFIEDNVLNKPDKRSITSNTL